MLKQATPSSAWWFVSRRWALWCRVSQRRKRRRRADIQFSPAVGFLFLLHLGIGSHFPTEWFPMLLDNGLDWLLNETFPIWGIGSHLQFMLPPPSSNRENWNNHVVVSFFLTIRSVLCFVTPHLRSEVSHWAFITSPGPPVCFILPHIFLSNLFIFLCPSHQNSDGCVCLLCCFFF